ncbi:uncharacterized protein UTRI_01446_B [Ustilago trichophora]|uniref:Uncharacterized protein n=1 Tax=Ustilago trichophora TaxID=86804 RepID=A0A5C3E621_9BASI|nr:uncharacterized protein UTRI_01446_B [Ustilago trichophora]
MKPFQKQATNQSSVPPPPPPPTPSSIPFLTVEPSLASLPQQSSTSALGRFNFLRPRANTIESQWSYDSLDSLDTRASLQAILDGVRGGRLEVMHQVPQAFFESQSTLDSLYPFVSESVLGGGEDEVMEPEAKVGGGFARARCAFFASLMAVVDRINPFSKKEDSVTLDDSESEFVSFDVLLAARAAANATAAKASDSGKGKGKGKSRDTTTVTATTTTTTTTATTVVPPIVIIDTDYANEILRLRGRGPRAIGYPRHEWTPSLHMADPILLHTPRFARSDIRPPPYCPCTGSYCFCYVTNIYPRRTFVDPREQAAAMAPWRAMKIKPRFETRSPLYNVFPSVTGGLNSLGAEVEAQSQVAGPSIQHQQQQGQGERRRNGDTKESPEIITQFFKHIIDEDEDQDEVEAELRAMVKQGSRSRKIMFWF